MTKIIENLEYLRKYPVFDSLTAGDKLDKNRGYTNLFLHRLAKRKLIRRIEKNKYTLFDDPFLIASRIVWPSYISCWNALSYHKLTEQVPSDIWVVATKSKKYIKFDSTKIRFVKIKTNCFFGYDKVRYQNSDAFIANPEKAIIDSFLLRKISFSEVKEIIFANIKRIKTRKFIDYLIKIGNHSLIKRFGFLFETIGKDYYNALKRHIDAVYIPLDYSKKPIGKKNEKWRLIINA